MIKVLISAFVLAAATAASSASANDIPLDIYWSGVAPTAAFISVPGGVEPLKRSGPEFYGTISVPPGPPERRTITLRYGNYNHSFDIRVLPILTRISFTVDHQAQHSCTRLRVLETSKASDNLLDAIKRSVNAGDLFNIEEPNACNRNLRFAAVRAEVLQNAAMQNLSHGLFLMNDELKKEYEAAARSKGTNVGVELASFETRDKQSEVTQLESLKSDAKDARNYDYALQIDEYMTQRIQSDPVVAALYLSRGVSLDQLKTDAVFLTTKKASAVGTPISYYGERGLR